MRSIACLSLALCMAANASEQPKLSPTEQEVLDVSQARRDASNRRDVAASARYVAEDCIFSSDDGVLVTKAEYYQQMESLPIEYDHSTNAREFVLRVHGDTAVINFRITTHEQFGDSDIVSEQRRTETWVKRDGSWLLIALQWDDLPVNFRQPIAVDTGVYKDYVGQYEWRPHGDVDVVSLKDGKLWSRFDKDEDEYLPLGAETFFIKSDLGSVTFVRDGQGHLTGYTYHRADGQEIHVKKVK